MALPAPVEEVEEGAPAWMVTFADLMTLLLCFFVLLFAISEVKQDKFSAAVNSFQTYFDFKGGAQVSDYLDKEQIQTFPDVYMEFLKGMGEAVGGADTDSVEGEYALTNTIREGTKVTVGGTQLFAPGAVTAELGPDGRSDNLDQIAAVIQGYRFRIDVRGHATFDEMEYVTDKGVADLNDLSYRRAKWVATYLAETAGIRPERLQITADGATDPLTRGDDPAGLIASRRVEIIASEEKVPYPGDE